jgi:hypothetical protein
VYQTANVSQILDRKVFAAVFLGRVGEVEALFDKIADPELKALLIHLQKLETEMDGGKALILPDYMISPNKYTGEVKSYPDRVKRIRKTNDKRFLQPCLKTSLPIGYAGDMEKYCGNVMTDTV